MTIDIMLPYYGDVSMMKAAVDSVLKQEDGDFKLTIVDDGYPDDALPAYFEGLVASDSRVSYHRNSQNLGANGNYRKCLDLLEHEFAVIMGADDVMLPNYVATVRAAFASGEDVDLVQPGVQIIDENGAIYSPLGDRIKSLIRRQAVGNSERSVLAGEKVVGSLLNGNWLYFPSVAWRSRVLKEHSFRTEYDVVQDLALALDVLMSGGKLLVTDTVCFQYRRHRESDSSLRALDGRRFDEERRFFQSYGDELGKMGWGRAAKSSRTHFTSRLNALSLMPTAASKGIWGGVRKLSRHILAS